MAKSQIIQYEHFRWRLSQRTNGVWYADGRSGNTLDVGRHSLSTKSKDEAHALTKQLDQSMALKFGLIEAVDEDVDEIEFTTIKDGSKMYLDWVGRPGVVKGASKATQARYRAVLDKFQEFAAMTGVKYWQQITKRVLVGYAGWLEDHDFDYKYSTQYFELTVLKQALKVFREDLEIRGIQKFKLELPKPEGTTTYCYSSVEVSAMVSYCLDDPGLVWLGQVISALAHTGLRISELAGLRWADIKGRWIELPDRSRQGSKKERATARTNKGRKTRRFPIHEGLAEVLGNIKRHKDGRIFHGPNGGVLKPDTVRNVLIREVLPPLKKRFPKDGDEKGFEHGRIHSLKHYFVSRCANDQVPVQLLKNWLWCKDSKMIDRYYHPDDDVAMRHMNSIKFVADDDVTM